MKLTYFVCRKYSQSFTFIGPCIANVFSEYNQHDTTFLRFIYYFKKPYMFAAGNSNGLTKSLTLYMQLWAPDDGRKTLLKHVQRLTEINKIEKCRILLVVFCECWWSVCILADNWWQTKVCLGKYIAQVRPHLAFICLGLSSVSGSYSFLYFSKIFLLRVS